MQQLVVGFLAQACLLAAAFFVAPQIWLLCPGRGSPGASLLLPALHESGAGAGLEPIAVYRLRGGPGSEPPHLGLVDLDDLVPNGSLPIHAAHAWGLPHASVWVHVVDSQGRLLVLRRTASLRTCPGAWSLLGEHQLQGEQPEALVRRAVREELGPQLLPLMGPMFNLTAGPVWYRRDYPDGRVDRQATWLWAVPLRGPAGELPLAPDEEVAELRWVAPSGLRDWARAAPGDFCHGSIVGLLRLALSQLAAVTEGAGGQRPA